MEEQLTNCKQLKRLSSEILQKQISEDYKGQMFFCGGDGMIRGYDEWKTTPPDDPVPVTYCNQCGAPLYEGEALYCVDGGICESCLEDGYRRIL